MAGPPSETDTSAAALAYRAVPFSSGTRQGSCLRSRGPNLIPAINDLSRSMILHEQLFSLGKTRSDGVSLGYARCWPEAVDLGKGAVKAAREFALCCGL